MPNTFKSFTYVTKNSPNFFASIKCLAKCIIQESELVSSRVSRYETKLKRCKNVIITEMIKQMFKYKSFEDFV